MLPTGGIRKSGRHSQAASSQRCGAGRSGQEQRSAFWRKMSVLRRDIGGQRVSRQARANQETRPCRNLCPRGVPCPCQRWLEVKTGSDRQLTVKSAEMSDLGAAGYLPCAACSGARGGRGWSAAGAKATHSAQRRHTLALARRWERGTECERRTAERTKGKRLPA